MKQVAWQATLFDHAMSQTATASATPAFLLRSMPAVFVLIWSTGFIVAKFGLPYAPPLTFLALRCLAAAAVLLPLVLVMKAPWPHGKKLHIAVSGLLLHGGYLGGVWCAIKLGMPAGVTALVVGLQPILTAFAAPLVGERVHARQWLGLAMGLGGVGLVVANKVSVIGLSWDAVWLALLALVSITAGTLYQKRFCPQFDLRSGTFIQYSAVAAVMFPMAWIFEGLGPVNWTPQFVAALAWSVLALSIGAIFLLFALIRRSAATSVSSLMYLTPPCTAVLAWILFGERFTMLGLAGMLLAVTGVAFVVRR